MQLIARLQISFVKHYKLILFISAIILSLTFSRCLADYQEVLIEDTTGHATSSASISVPINTGGAFPNGMVYSVKQQMTATQAGTFSRTIVKLKQTATGGSANFTKFWATILDSNGVKLAISDERSRNLLGTSFGDFTFTLANFTLESGKDLNFTLNETFYFMINVDFSGADWSKWLFVDDTDDDLTYSISRCFLDDIINCAGFGTRTERYRTYFTVWNNPLALPTFSCDGDCPVNNNVASIDYVCTDGGAFYGINRLLYPTGTPAYLNEDCAENGEGILELPIVEGQNSWDLYILDSAIGTSDTGNLVIPYFTDDESPLPPEVLTPDLTILNEPFNIDVRCLQDNSVLKYSIDTIYQADLGNCTAGLVIKSEGQAAIAGEHQYCFWVQNDGTVNIKHSTNDCITVTGKGLKDSCVLTNDLSNILTGDEGTLAGAVNSFLQRILNTAVIGDAMIINCMIYHDFYNNLTTENVTDLTYHLKAFGLDQNVNIPLEDVKAEMTGWTTNITGFSAFKTLLTAFLWTILIFALYMVFFHHSKPDNSNKINDDTD